MLRLAATSLTVCIANMAESNAIKMQSRPPTLRGCKDARPKQRRMWTVMPTDWQLEKLDARGREKSGSSIYLSLSLPLSLDLCWSSVKWWHQTFKLPCGMTHKWFAAYTRGRHFSLSLLSPFPPPSAGCYLCFHLYNKRIIMHNNYISKYCSSWANEATAIMHIILCNCSCKTARSLYKMRGKRKC